METRNNRPEPAADGTVSTGERPRIVVICGPTAVGKTALGIALAKQFNGEVVNADSRYFYRGFDIGVAKPDIIERQGVPHHLIDILPPTGEMSLARYQDLAMECIAGIIGRNRLPLLVGGTPLYINAVVEGWKIPRVPPNPAFRARLEAAAAREGVPALAERLRQVDPITAARSGTNLRRVIRALEVFEHTGQPMSAVEGKGPPPFDALELGLTRAREALYRAIDGRVSEQIERGLVAELRALLEGGVSRDAPAMSSLGYRQLLPYLDGEMSLDEAVERIRFDTHRYVRHQETWLRRNPRITWIDTGEAGWESKAFAVVRAFLRRPARSAGGGS